MIFQLYAMHCELSRDIDPTSIYCLLQKKIQVVYDRMLNEVGRTNILAFPERILLDVESAAINACWSAFPSATVTVCYFHLTQSVMRKVNEIGMKEGHKKNDSFCLAHRCQPSLAMVPSSVSLNFFDTSW